MAQSMYHSALCLLLIVIAGCSPGADSVTVEPDSLDGGTVENPDRDQAQRFLSAFSKVKSADEERELATEFGEWLKEHDYKIQAELKNGQHRLICPYFPPVTPWTDHSFFDVKNLDLLRRL